MNEQPKFAGRVVEFFRWDIASVALVTFMALILVVWFSEYFPSWTISLGWQWFVGGFWIVGVSLVILGKATLAIMGERTPLIMTPDGTFRCSDGPPRELPPLSGSVSLDRLRQAGVEIPSYMLTNNALNTSPGADEHGRPIRFWRYRVGGYRMWELWASEPKDGVLIVGGTKIADIGDKVRGGCYFTPASPSSSTTGRFPRSG
jgi:hypothetical protein